MAQIISNPFIVALIIGFLLDSLWGDPLWLPHPIRWFGKAISWFEQQFNRGNKRKMNGLLSAVILIASTWSFLTLFFFRLEPYADVSLFFSSIGVFYGLANHGLIKEAYKVEKVLRKQGVEAARKQLSMIVGRDTSQLNAHQIRTAILETLAENLSDGVVAPLFFYTLGGVPLMLAYKMAQTLDSMIGYKSERYKDFGWFAARFDDVLNFIPARLTALLMVVVSFSWRGLFFIFKYGRKHASPNAGMPEAALAGILNVQFGGPNVYHGKLMDKPFIGKNARDIAHLDIVKACMINAAVTVLSVVLVIFVFCLKG